MIQIEKCEVSIQAPFQFVELHFWQGDMQETRTIKFRDFVTCLNQSIESGDRFCRIGTLPDGFYDGIIDMQVESTFKTIIVVPAGKRMINYFGELFYIPFPFLSFFISVKNGNVTNTKLFALDNKKSSGINKETTICNYPFGNVGSNGDICWGRNSLPNIRCIAESTILIELFFGSETNMDLYHGPNGHPEYADQRGLIEAVERLDEFPVSLLNVMHRKFIDDVESFINI